MQGRVGQFGDVTCSYCLLKRVKIYSWYSESYNTRSEKVALADLMLPAILY